MNRRMNDLTVVALLLLLVAASACTREKPTPVAPTQPAPTTGPTSAPAALPTPTNPPQSTPAAQSVWVAADAATCTSLQDAMSQALGVPASAAEADFRDPILEGVGKGCQVIATGSGVNFKDPASAAVAVKKVLILQGWHEDVRYVADGPMGTAAGFRKGNQLCVLYSTWKPSDDAQYDKDKPASEWNLQPEQQIYTIRAICAVDTSAPAASPAS